MEEIVRLINNIGIETKHLSTEKIQDVLITAKRCKKSSGYILLKWNNLAEILWSHIETGLEKMDDQFLCATCFFSVLVLTDKQDEYVNKMQEIVERDISLKATDSKESQSHHAASLMYGMFQSSFLAQTSTHSTIAPLLNSTFDLLNLMGYEYSQFTFIAFKTINAFKKVCETYLQKVIFSPGNQIKLLNLVNHNWENPITGVRDLIKGIFQTLVNILEPDTLKSIIQEINGFSWNKAKYLMLSEIIDNHKCKASLYSDPCWVDGLINSLHKPGLVSAGADMYYAVLKKIFCEDVWCKLFLSKIVGVLQGSSNKAIENFGNYWLPTTLKKIPRVMSILFDEIDIHGQYTSNEYYSILVLMKQGNKLGIMDRNWHSIDKCTRSEKIILSAIQHSNTQVRMLAFDIICFVQEKLMPSSSEFSLVLDYIKNNMNSDCTVLRMSMLYSLDIFLTQLHVIYKNQKDMAKTIWLMNFCIELQDIMIMSLNINGNYQRKCANVKMLNVIIGSLSNTRRKRKNCNNSTSASIKQFLEAHECWKLHDETTVSKIISLLEDPSDDIRENTVKLLLNHYSEDLSNTEMMNDIIQSALCSMKSKFFFEISCGRSMFKLIVNLLLIKTQEEAMFNSLDDVFNYGYEELLSEFKLKRDIIRSIEDGKQLHSFINILQVVLEICIKNSYKLNILDENMNVLLDILQGITNQFTWEQQNSTSSDFSKMNDIIEDIIAQSGYSLNEVTDDETKISGLHQIILNCIWLNVKASCDLALLIMNYHKDDVEKCEKCLNIITHVLETSRHKGAIEAAGTALGCGIQLLTSLPESARTSRLPQTLLKAKLDILILEASKMASITRRGAGLSIMVHRIVSSDMRKGKPLFHYFMKTLLKTCQTTDDVPSSHDIENQMDLPQAIVIHFLTKIVMDSSLASDMMFYSSELAELAFSNLTSSHWQIRNAALQLYGALIPRLIGQKKPSGTDDETIATVACDELRTHSPKLWKFITEQLKIKSHSSEVIYHSDLVPILNMLASSAKRYNFSHDSRLTSFSDAELLDSLIRLLNSSIHAVRRLTAKCIFNIFSFESICDAFKKVNFKSENFIHGSLMLMKLCHKYYNLQDTDGSTAKAFKDVCALVNKEQSSYCSKEIYASIHAQSERISHDDVKHVLAVLDANNNAPGVFDWAQTCVKIHLTQCQWEDIPQDLMLILKRNDFEIYCEMLLCKIETETLSESVMKKVVAILLSFEKKYESGVIWKILYEISCRIDLDSVNVTAILRDLDYEKVSYKLRYVIPFAAKLFVSINGEHQQKLANKIFEMSDFENSDVDMRYMAALANNELPKSFHKVEITDSVKLASIKTAIILLQDEDEDVRNICVYYYKNIANLEMAVHPNICLNKILDYNFLSSIFREHQSVDVLCKDLLQLLSYNAHDVTDDYNPFANDSKNIYLEVDMLRKTLENIILNFE